MIDRDYLKIAIEQARESLKKGGFPAGAVLVKNGKIVSEAISRSTFDPSAHAELLAIKTACQKLETFDLTGATLYGSLQACTMCFSVANWAKVSRIVFAVKKNPELIKKGYYEGATDSNKLNEENTHKIELVYIPGLEKESLNIVRGWEKKNLSPDV